MTIKMSKPIHRFSHFAMSTEFEVVIAGVESNYAGQASQAVFHEIDRLERLLTRFDDTSEVGMINRLSPGEECSVGIEVLECLEISERIHAQTGGAFDVNVRNRTREKSLTGSTASSASALPPSFPLKVKRSGKRFVVFYPEENTDEINDGIDIDLGGIGKGYALDKAFEILRDWSIENAFLHAGTSTVLAAGYPDSRETGEKGWPLGVASGWETSSPVNRVILKNRALSGSGKKIKGEHIIDPFTGEPAKGHDAAWVSHPVAAEADALSTAFIVMETDAVKDYCREHPEVWALLIRKNKTALVINPEVLNPIG